MSVIVTVAAAGAGTVAPPLQYPQAPRAASALAARAAAWLGLKALSRGVVEALDGDALAAETTLRDELEIEVGLAEEAALTEVVAERALEEDRARPEPWTGQVRALIDMGQSEEALTWLEQAANVVGETPELLSLWAIAAARCGQAEDAVAWSDRAMRHGQDAAEVWLARAEVLYLRGAVRVAGSTLSKAHEREPDAATARRCGEVALSAGDLPTARGWLERACREDPDGPLVALRLGVYWAEAGYLDRARTELERALALEPGLDPARLALEDLAGRGPLARLASLLRRLRHG